MSEKEKLEARLGLELANGEITVEEAEDEYQNFMNRNEGRYGWGWDR